MAYPRRIVGGALRLLVFALATGLAAWWSTRITWSELDEDRLLQNVVQEPYVLTTPSPSTDHEPGAPPPLLQRQARVQVASLWAAPTMLNATTFAFAGDHVYVANPAQRGLRAFRADRNADSERPLDSREVAGVEPRIRLTNIWTLSDSRVMLHNANGHLELYSQPQRIDSRLTLEATWTLGEQVFGVCALGERVYAATSGSPGLQLLRLGQGGAAAEKVAEVVLSRYPAIQGVVGQTLLACDDERGELVLGLKRFPYLVAYSVSTGQRTWAARLDFAQMAPVVREVDSRGRPRVTVSTNGTDMPVSLVRLRSGRLLYQVLRISAGAKSESAELRTYVLDVRRHHATILSGLRSLFVTATDTGAIGLDVSTSQSDPVFELIAFDTNKGAGWVD